MKTSTVKTQFRLVVLTVCFSVAKLNAAETTTSLALIPATGDRQPTAAVMNRLEAAWLQQPNVTLVERHTLEKILTEHQMTGAELVEAKARVQLGQFVPADVLVFVDSVPKLPKPATRVQVTESKSGIVLTSQILENEALLRDPQTALELVGMALAKREVPPEQRHLLGYLDFRSEESGPLLEGLAVALGTLVVSDLARAPHIIVLEREYLKHLQTERDLTSLEQNLRASVRQLVGGIRRTADTNQLVVSVSLRPLAGGEPLVVSLTVPANDILTARRLTTQKIADLLKIKPPELPQADRFAEAKVYYQQAKQWKLWGDRMRAVQVAETAFALDSTYSNRYLIADSLWIRDGNYGAWSASAKPSEVLRANHALLDCYAMQRRAIVAETPTYAFFASLGCQLNGDERKALKNGQQPVWVLPFFHYWTHSHQVTADPELQAELNRSEEAVFRAQLEHYTQYYDQTRGKYWGVWQERLRCLSSYYFGDLNKQAQLVREAADAFAHPPGRPEARLPERFRMFESVYFSPSDLWYGSETHGPRLVRSAAVETVYRNLLQELTRHSDPYIRFWAYQSLEKLAGVNFKMNLKPPEVKAQMYPYREGYLELLLKELGPSHPYRGGPCASEPARTWNDVFFYSQVREFNYQFKAPPTVAPRELELTRRLLKQVIEFNNLDRLKALGNEGQVYLSWLERIADLGDPTEALALADEIAKLYPTPALQKTRDELQRRASREPAPVAPPKPKPPEIAANGAGWDDYDLRPLNFGWMGSTGSYAGRSSLLIAADGNLLYEVRPFSKGHNPLGAGGDADLEFKIRWLPTGEQLDRLEIPLGLKGADSWKWMAVVYGMTVGGDTVYIGTGGGLLCVNPKTKKWKMLTPKDGLPGTIVRSVGWYAGKLYLGIGCEPYHCATPEQSVFAVYDPQPGTFEMLAAEKAVSGSNSWNGVRFNLDDIIPDPSRPWIWLRDRDRGIWKYRPENQSFELVVSGPRSLTVPGSRYVRSAYLCLALGLFRPDTQTVRPLPGMFDLKVLPEWTYKEDQQNVFSQRARGCLENETLTIACDGDNIIAGAQIFQRERCLFILHPQHLPAFLWQPPAGKARPLPASPFDVPTFLRRPAEDKAFPGAFLVQDTPAGIVAVTPTGTGLLIRRKTRLNEYRLSELQAASGDTRETELLDAAEAGNQERLQQLLTGGVSMQATDRRGWTALHYASSRKHTGVALWLIAQGASVTNQALGGSVLSVAAAANEPRIVEALLKKTREVDALANNGCSPLGAAVDEGAVDAARLLIKAGADLNRIAPGADENPLLFQAIYAGHLEMVKLLVEQGASLQRSDRYGNTALIAAASCGQTNIIQYLAAKGMKVNAGNRDGLNALMLAAWNRQVGSAKALLAAGADVNAKRPDGRTALMLAAEADSPEIVRLLIQHGANIDEIESNEFTALVFAARQGALESIQVLLDAGAALKAPSRGSPLIMYSRNAEVRALLKNAMEKTPKKQ